MEERVLDTDAVVNGAKIRGVHILVAALGAGVLCVDGFTSQVIGFIVPNIAKEMRISPVILGWVLSSSIIGTVLGYLVVSPLAGRYGHKHVAMFSVALFGVLEILTTLAQNDMEIIVLRLVTGIGLGGAIPSAVALTGEYFPLRRRATAITLIYMGLSIGQLLAGEVAKALLVSHGWRAVLWVGGGASLCLALLMALLLPDSIEYLINKKKRPDRAEAILRRIEPSMDVAGRTLRAGTVEKRKADITQLFRDGRAFGTLAIWLGLSMNLIVTSFLHGWLTTMLVNAGVPQNTAILASQIAGGSGIAAAFIVGPLIDRFGPYVVMTLLFLGAALSLALLGLSLTGLVMAAVFTMAFFSGFFTSGIQKSANALSVYFYPTALRGAGLGYALGVGRITAIFAPPVVGQLIVMGWAASSIFAVMAVPLTCGAVCFFVMGRHYWNRAPLGSAAPAHAVPH